MMGRSLMAGILLGEAMVGVGCYRTSAGNANQCNECVQPFPGDTGLRPVSAVEEGGANDDTNAEWNWMRTD